MIRYITKSGEFPVQFNDYQLVKAVSSRSTLGYLLVLTLYSKNFVKYLQTESAPQRIRNTSQLQKLSLQTEHTLC
jgi:hypothetical protein